MALSGEKEFNTEFRVLWPSGEVRYIRALAKVLRDADGKPLRMVGTNWDITDRKLAEEEMEKTSVRLLLATQAGGEGVWDYDILQNQLVWDDQMYALYGITRDTFGGAYESWRAGVHPEDVERGDKEVQMALSGEKEFNTEFRVLWPSGEVRHIRAQARVLRDADGKPLRMVGTNWDITERKRAEEEMQETNRQLEEATAHANEMAAQAEAASRAKSDFLANMSHEIRTPMNAITGMAYLALQTNLDPRQYDYVSKIQQAADSLLRIINDILDFSKIEAGKLELESIPFKLGDLFDHLATITSGRAEEKGLEILFSLPVGFRQTLLGDPLRLGQVLGNLAGNAVKFTEKGHVIIAVELAGALENNSIPLTFSIQDTGIGMSSDQLTLVFEAFSQADNSITRKYGGTGLGLSIVNRLLALMDSSLKVESEPGRGSRFSFTVHLPLAEEPLQKPADMSENLMGLRVLVVDDNAAAREILGSMMTSFRFNVTAVDSGGAAVAEIHAGALSGDPYSLVLMDWMMPEMDGFEAIRRIREDNTLVQPPAIVMVTAFGGDELRRQVLQLEKTAYVTKPVQPSAMFNTILELFGIGERQSVRYRRANILQMDGLKRIRGARVLVVEDNTINQQVAREIIEQGGILVSIAGNGHTAVALIEAGEEFDAVLMDIQMPDMNGYEACRIIRQSRSAEELPIIAMSAHAMAEDREKCLAAGMNDYVSKPVNPQELYTSLITWIKRDITEPPFNDQSQSSVRQREKHSNLPASLPGLDVASGVMRAGGNRRLYCQILADFKEQNRNVVEELRTALECSDSGRAAAIAHTLKGLSATIGAMSLAATVSDLEQAVKADAGDTCSVLFSRLEQQLAELFESVSILKAAQLFSETDDTVVTPLPQDEFEALIRTLHESLRNNSLGARKYVELLHGQIGGLEWKELNKYTSQLDYEKAADVLERIAKQGGFNLHGGK
jgi:PAS domain S-box-containing protein